MNSPDPDQLINAARIGNLADLASSLASGFPVNYAPSPVYNREISAEVGDVTALMGAAACGQTAAVAFLLDHGAAIDQSDGTGTTPLHCAIENKQSAALRLLVDRGADLTRSSMGGSVLACATRFMPSEDVRYLLTHGADANEVYGDGKTPLAAAAENRRADLVQLLIEYGADPLKPSARGYTPLGIATNNRDQLMLLALQSPTETDPGRKLSNAAQSGDLTGIRNAIAKGAKINAIPKPDKNGSNATPLMYAAICGQLEASALLLDLGARIDLAGEFGTTPLHCAVCNKHLPVVRLLVERGAKLSACAYYDGYPLSLATVRNSPETVEYLIERGADVNAVVKWGETVLGAAVLHRHLEVARILIDHGADPRKKDRDGRSAIDMARQTGTAKFPEWKDLLARMGL